MDEEQREAPRRGFNINWLGIVAFIVIAFGRRIVGFVQWLFAGGTSLLPGSFDLTLVLAGGAVIALVVAAAVTLRAGRRGEMVPPTSPTMPPASRANAPMPPFGGPNMPTMPTSYRPTIASQPPASSTGLPSATRFEPIINARVALALGVVAALFAGAFLVLQFVIF